MISNLRGQALGVCSNAYIDPYPIRTLQEVNYKAQPTQTMTAGNTYSIDGIWHQFGDTQGSKTVMTNGIGAVMSCPTAGGLSSMGINNVNYLGKQTSMSRIIGADRLRRGGWAIWVKIGAYNLTANGSWIYIPCFHAGAYPQWHAANRRGYNIHGTASNATGGLASWFCINSDVGASMYGAVTSSANVTVMYFRSLYEVEHYYGNTTTDTWPAFEDLTLGGVSRPAFALKFDALQAVYTDPASFTMYFGANASTTGQYFNLEKWRITSWD